MTAFKHASRRTLRSRLALVGVAASGALALAACGGNDDSASGTGHTGHSSSPSAPAESPASADFDDADVAFAQGMIPHHQQALEMAQLVDGRASDQEIENLAAQIEKAQDPEIKTMQSWLKAWGKPESSAMDHGEMNHGDMDHGSSMKMAGMMSSKDMEKLKTAKGAVFDRDFARMMIEHHNGAIQMAKDEQKNGRNTDAKKLAAAVIKGQSAEVDQLNKILDRL